VNGLFEVVGRRTAGLIVLSIGQVTFQIRTWISKDGASTTELRKLLEVFNQTAKRAVGTAEFIGDAVFR
jgi:hypothetical protein